MARGQRFFRGSERRAVPADAQETAARGVNLETQVYARPCRATSGKVARPMFSATGLCSYLSFRKPQNLSLCRFQENSLASFSPTRGRICFGRFCELYDKFLFLSRAKYCGGPTTSALRHADRISAPLRSRKKKLHKSLPQSLTSAA